MDVGGDGGGADHVLKRGEFCHARRDDVRGSWVLACYVLAARDHLGLAVGADGCRVGVELAAAGELPLGEPQRRVEQRIEVGLRLR